MAKALALATGKPLIALNHLEAHALTARLVEGVAYPYLLLLVSGGHCQLLICRVSWQFQRLGTTIDDAVGRGLRQGGEAAGPWLSRRACHGRRRAGAGIRRCAPVPAAAAHGGRRRAMISFVGLKSAVRRHVEVTELTDQAIAGPGGGLPGGVRVAALDRPDAELRRRLRSGSPGRR
jgi:N6-L-threonylcarbamoyladenine synthase